MISVKHDSGQFFDLLKGARIGVSVQPNSLGEINTRSGLTSYEFDLPLTQKNILLLANADTACTIISNNRELSSGTLNVYEYDEVAKKAKCSFLGGNISWFERIKGKLLTDTDLDLSHFYNVENVVSSFTKKDGFIYVPLEFGRSYNELAPIFNTNTADIAPSVYAHSLFRQILQDAGVSVTGDLFDDELFMNVVLPPAIERFLEVGQDEVALQLRGALQSIATTLEKLELSNVLAENVTGYYDSVNSVFTNINTIPILIQFDVYVQESNSYRFDIPADFGFVLNATPNIYFSFIIHNGDYYSTSYHFKVLLQPGDTIYLFYSSNSGGSFYVFKTDIYITELEMTTGSFVNPVKLLPEMSQEEFVKWILVSFGVILYLDEKTNVLNCGLFKNLPFKTATDWGSKIVKTLTVNVRELTQSYSQSNKMTYEGNDDDTLLAGLTESQLAGAFPINDPSLEKESDWYASPFTATLQSVSFQGGTAYLVLPNVQRFAVEQESVASGSIQTGVVYTVSNYTTVTYNGLNYVDGDTFTGVINKSTYTTVGDGYVYKDVNEERVDPGARVLIVRRETPVVSLSGGVVPFGDIAITDGTTTINHATMPYAYFHPTVNINDFLESLSYGLMGLIALGQTTMVDKYLSYIVSVIDNRQLVKFRMKLTDTDINNIDYSRPIYLDCLGFTGNYFLSKIDNYDGEGLTGVYLIKLI